MKPLLNTVDAVLFDLDGTLVETNIDFPLMKREMVALAVESGIATEDVQDFDILGIIEHICRYLKGKKTPEAIKLVRARAMSTLQQIELRHADKTREIPFAKKLVERLRDHGIAIGIVTRNCRRASELSLNLTGIHADVLICREDAINHKPHPEPLLLALTRLNARSGNSVMVGDHIMDMQGGKAAGMKTIGFLRETRDDDFFAGVEPDFVTRDLREVLDAIIHRDS
jgi:HAD superfamily hydrolase (TIGR01549 family)